MVEVTVSVSVNLSTIVDIRTQPLGLTFIDIIAETVNDFEFSSFRYK